MVPAVVAAVKVGRVWVWVGLGSSVTPLLLCPVNWPAPSRAPRQHKWDMCCACHLWCAHQTRLAPHAPPAPAALGGPRPGQGAVALRVALPQGGLAGGLPARRRGAAGGRAAARWASQRSYAYSSSMLCCCTCMPLSAAGNADPPAAHQPSVRLRPTPPLQQPSSSGRSRCYRRWRRWPMSCGSGSLCSSTAAGWRRTGSGCLLRWWTGGSRRSRCAVRR